MGGNKKSAFVIMPFDAEFNEIYRSFLTPTLQQVGYDVSRADDLYDQQNILRSVVASIAAADLVIADLTSLNANVFYELGVAHTLRRPTILLTQNLDELPFDLRSYRVIPYSTHFARIDEARTALTTTAEGALAGTIEFGSPVSDFCTTILANGVVVPATSQLPEDEPGWLDHLVLLEEGYAELTKILAGIATATTSVGDDTKLYGQRIERTRATAGRQVNSALRFIATEYSRRLAQYGEELAVANAEYERIATSTQNSIEFIILHGRIDSVGDKEALEQYLETLAPVGHSATEARETFDGMRNTVRNIEGIEKGLTRSARVVGEELDRLVTNIDRTVASVRRGVEVGRTRLGDLDVSKLLPKGSNAEQSGPDV